MFSFDYVIMAFLTDEFAFETKLDMLLYPTITVGDRTVALKIIARCSITQTPTGQS